MGLIGIIRPPAYIGFAHQFLRHCQIAVKAIRPALSILGTGPPPAGWRRHGPFFASPVSRPASASQSVSRPPSSISQPQASSLNPQASSLQPPPSSLPPPASSLQPPASSLQPPASSLQPPAPQKKFSP